MLYFSDTVCVFTSSSLSALEPGLDKLESRKGLSNALLSRLLSESQLDRLDEALERSGDRNVGSSRKRCGLPDEGDNRRSDES